MKILVYGAGVLGSLYATRLQDSGQDVSILARGQRLADIRQYGIVLCDEITGEETVTRVTPVEYFEADDIYDWILVLVRKNQLPAVLPALGANRNTPNILFMVNNAAGPDALIRAVGRERVVLGFVGAGGAREGHIVRYLLTNSQKTTIGELNGEVTPRLQQIAAALQTAGFKTRFSGNMDAWLKAHVALVSPVANAIYAVGGSMRRVTHTPDALVLMIRAIREGLQALNMLGAAAALPPAFRVMVALPEPLLVPLVARLYDNERIELVTARHANAARDEMAVLADELMNLVKQAGVPSPALDRLYAYLDPNKTVISEGSRTIPLDWLEMGRLIVPMAGTALLFAMLLRLMRKHA